MRAFRIAYDGRPFHGFQRQPAVATVEDALFEALAELEVVDPDRHRPPGYSAASRTDAGVSATAQTITLEAPDWLSPRAFNSALPPTVRAWATAPVEDDFHAGHHATQRRYTYHLHAPVDGSEVASPVDDDRVSNALERLAGTHDYHNLSRDDTGTERTLTLEADREGDFLEIGVGSDGYPRELVRRLVSLVRAIGQGDTSLERIDRLLDPAPLDGPKGVGPAPAEPLVLTNVAYPALRFERDREAAAGARAIFDRERIQRATGARVMGHLRTGLE